MMLDIKYSKQAVRFLKNADKILVKRLLDKINCLQKQPVLHDSKRIEPSQDKLYRVRVGHYRILYDVNHNRNIIGIVKIDKRSRVYA